MTDDYAQKKKKFDDMITLYGRKPVLEILNDKSVTIYRLHLAESNARGDIIEEIETLAEARNVDIQKHSKQALSRISKNAKQDQGVAIDIQPQRYRPIDDISNDAVELIALDAINNPQNLGMIIRSVAGSTVDGLILPKKGCAKIDPLVHKASAGTLIKASIYHCATLDAGLKNLREKGFTIIGMDANNATPLAQVGTDKNTKRVFIMGNETTGLSDETRQLCDFFAAIPLSKGVESINVAATASIVAFRRMFAG
jgi:23S rRNA (guanosine2251-2'-O)-methyltransferase